MLSKQWHVVNSTPSSDPNSTRPKLTKFGLLSSGVAPANRACFPTEKHQNSQKWAKFMNFSFWPFLWFGLPGRLLIFPLCQKRVQTLKFCKSSLPSGNSQQVTSGFEGGGVSESGGFNNKKDFLERCQDVWRLDFKENYEYMIIVDGTITWQPLKPSGP